MSKNVDVTKKDSGNIHNNQSKILCPLPTHSIWACVFIEFISTSLLLIAVVGSGIMAQRLYGANEGEALLANSIATGGALVALILAFGPVSGAHMNPVATIAAALCNCFPWQRVPAYIVSQVIGAIFGVILTHAMFDLSIIQLSHHVRTGSGQWIAEAVATFGLLSIVWGCRAHAGHMSAFAVAAYITGAYWFTASTSFANPAVTIARCLTDTFAGIRPDDVFYFILAQAAGLIISIPVMKIKGMTGSYEDSLSGDVMAFDNKIYE